jgi:hypothetical protein
MNPRAMPPAPYPAPSFDPPLVLNQPQTMDFRDAVTALLPEKSGPPGWLVMVALVASLVGGAALAHRVTRGQVAVALAAPTGSEAKLGDKTGDPALDKPDNAPAGGDSTHQKPAGAAVTAEPQATAAAPGPQPRGDLGGDAEPMVDPPEAASPAVAASPAKPAAKARPTKAQAKRRTGKAQKGKAKR